MKMRRKFSTQRSGPYSGVAFRQVAVAGGEAAAGEFRCSAPANWPLSAVTAFAESVLAEAITPAARQRVRERGVPAALHRCVAEATTRPAAPEQDIRAAIDRAAGALARAGFDNGYFDTQQDALAFHDELRAILVSRRAALDPALWRSCGLGWAYGHAEARPGYRAGSNGIAERVAGGSLCRLPDPPAARLFEAGSPDFEYALQVQQRRDAEAAAIATGRAAMAKAEARIASAVTTGPADPAQNHALGAALAAARDAGIPPTAAQRIMDRALEGLPPAEYADTHLDADSDIWDALPDVPPVAVSLAAEDADARHDAAAAVFTGSSPAIRFADTAEAWALGPTETAEDGRPLAAAPRVGATINMARFYVRDGAGGDIDAAGLIHTARILTIALDIAAGAGACESPASAEAAVATRALEISLANVAPLLMSLGLAYGSDEGRAMAGSLAALVTAATLGASADLAGQLGPCPAYASSAETASRVLGNMQRAMLGQASGYDALKRDPQRLYPFTALQGRVLDAARHHFDKAVATVCVHGLRNLGLTGVAADPGAEAILACDASGLAPMRALVQHRRLAPDIDGGAIYKVISPAVPDGLRALSHDEASVERLVDYVVGRGSLAGAPGVNHELLRERGFAEEDIEAVETQLATAGNIRAAFTPYVLGWTCAFEGLGDLGTGETLAAADILGRLDFTDWEIEHANLYCCGALTLEGAPGLPAEHLPVFDCAEPCGPIGARQVSARDRMLMAAAVQPFVTGGIALDLTLPHDATLGEISQLIRDGEAAGLRSIRLTRDGTDMTAPVTYDDLFETAGAPARPDEASIERVAQCAMVRSIESDDEPAASRARLPDRRKGYTQKARVGGHNLYLRTGEYDDGQLGEIFLDMHKEGASFRSLMNNFAIAVSLGLQYGVPLEEFVDAFTGTRFEPSGEVEGNAAITTASSILDYVFRELAVSYLEREDLAEVPPAAFEAELHAQASPASRAAPLSLASTGYVRRRLPENPYELRPAAVTGEPAPHTASGEEALSPPSVSGPSRETRPKQEGA